ncbi:RNA ligase [Desarmillaria tabescens]|uniref:RNA ligase n=1 Tax=Armillaria tabescens TaxID=1929756 RepID=A0AA39TJ82_ARMTA|nr:RNA ligase [Desarmillaria tabescens]KAK0460932.1 RNA ligase [Desarmillaria tabescens]
MSTQDLFQNPKVRNQDSQLISDLASLATKKPKLVNSTVYDAPADPTIKVRSWKMNEYKYYDVPSPFPSLVRGIFSVDLPENRHRIVARGYDKFFNIGEVPWTTWDALEKHTRAPYLLSLKSNGCIIFIAALTPSKLLITSKHSIGKVGNSEKSHAEVGEVWLSKYLAQKGRTEADLAKRLWDSNWTAVAELCDDSFEEHVLPYPPELTGLHLHGINESTKGFRTMHQDVVDTFADEWGFIKTLSTTLNSIEEVRTFTDSVSRAGHWEGQAVEGFVVRTHIRELPNNDRPRDAPPYAAGSTFFFKVKFDEPYMIRYPISKMKRPETKQYVHWVINEIKRDRKQFAQFGKGKGIIATRERFLAWMELNKNKPESRPASPTAKQFGKTVIVPVAIPGCGKTAVAVALAHIFGFGHTQSDDVRAKKAAPVFLKNVTALLKKHYVVIADKNNHLRQHRDGLREALSRFSPPVRLVALNWSWALSLKPPSTIHRICGDRILLRGDKHQSLHGDSQTKSHEEVIWQFINNTQELSESEVDACINMEIEDTMEQAVARAVEGCVKVLGLEQPSQEKIDEGLQVALGYEPKSTKSGPKKVEEKKQPPIRYFGLVVEVNLPEALESKLPDDGFWTQLKDGGRVAKRPHVTIVHQKSLPAETALWERCMALHQLGVPPTFELKLGNVVWNERIMAVSVDDLKVVNEGDGGQKGTEFLEQLAEDVKGRLHITVGTRDDKVPPVEAKDLGSSTPEVKSVVLEGVMVRGRIKVTPFVRS